MSYIWGCILPSTSISNQIIKEWEKERERNREKGERAENTKTVEKSVVCV